MPSQSVNRLYLWTLRVLSVGILLSLPGVMLAQQHPGPGEWGDAPEGAPAYPALGIAGAFPTCFGGPSG